VNDLELLDHILDAYEFIERVADIDLMDDPVYDDAYEELCALVYTARRLAGREPGEGDS